MGFKVKNESASAGTRRIARELVDEAVELIEEKKEDPAETIQSPTDYAIMQTCPHTSHACRL